MKSNSSNTHDKYSSLLHDLTISTDEVKKNELFSDYVKKRREDILSPSGKKLSTRELANQLGIDYEHFRKILNMNKPTKKRDCIIAICLALRLNPDETNKALIMYQYMPVLDTFNPRDDFLIDILEGQFTNPLSINEINHHLRIRGFPELDIIDHRRSVKPQLTSENIQYKILKKTSADLC